MMAVESPLYPSSGGLVSAFSPYTDSPASPMPPGFQKSPRFSSMAHEPSDLLRHQTSQPQSRPSSRPPSQPAEESTGDSSSVEPSPIDPSPITSNGTEIDDSADEDDPRGSFPRRRALDGVDHAEIAHIDTTVPNRPRSGSDETPQSVIHVPSGFKDLEPEDETKSSGQRKRSPPPYANRKTPSPAQRMDYLPESSPTTVNTAVEALHKNTTNSPLSPPPLTTDVPPSKYLNEGTTPRAQTRQEIEFLEGEKPRKQRSTSLEDIPEAHDQEHALPEEHYVDHDVYSPTKTLSSIPVESEEEIKALKTALGECWTLCNTLAGLSSIHRERIFNFAGTGNIQEQAWKTCWKLCQKLYDSRDEDQDSHVRPTLDLCRDFCQALFDVRQRDNEVADSVLRVSFELNNHLYNTHDRNLPEAFRERTLDFYITLCHRLMKQRSILAEETDSLLRACWSLAEMLFSLRQNRREGKTQDEELLGSAVQACWELCDLFREGWTQVRPDRGTPRPSQTTFSHSYTSQLKQRDLEAMEEEQNHHEPETPTTIFEDTAASPDGDETSPPPNILVLGTSDIQSRGSRAPRWSSNASNLSGYSASSAETSSTATTTAIGAQHATYPNRLKTLIVKAAMSHGFPRGNNSGGSTSGTGSGSQQSLQQFVASLPPTAFGTLNWQVTLLDEYRKMVAADRTFRSPIDMTSRRVSAKDVAHAVRWVARSGQHFFLKDLFRLVFGFSVDEADAHAHVFIQT